MLGRDQAATAGAVLDDRGLELLRKGAAELVDQPARLRLHDDADRARGIGVLRGGG
jgi:hypothetical protein